MRRSATRDLLRTLCVIVEDEAGASDLLAAVDSADVPHLMRLARAHGVEAWLAGYAPDGAPWRELAEQRRRIVAARVRTLGEIRRVGAVLDRVGRWVVVKGQAVAEDIYPRPHLRYEVDIDILVLPGRFGAAVTALVDCGWQLLDTNWPLFVHTVPGELRLRSPSGGLIDLHWHLLNATNHRRRFRMPTAELLGRRRTLASGVPALDLADQLLHLTLHGALAGATRLSWLLEVSRAARRMLTWGTLLERARAARATDALVLVLDRARRWLPETPNPRIDCEPGWRVICRTVDAASPLSARPDEPSLARSFARSVSGNARQSLAELSRHGLEWLVGGARRSRPPSPLRDPNDARSPMFPVDDPAARASYLKLVAQVTD